MVGTERTGIEKGYGFCEEKYSVHAGLSYSKILLHSFVNHHLPFTGKAMKALAVIMH